MFRILRWEPDVQDMIEAARNERDAALIAVQFEAGLRSGELQSLTICDIFRGEHTTGLHVDGKPGERAVHLITSVQHLRRRLAGYVLPSNSKASLHSSSGPTGAARKHSRIKEKYLKSEFVMEGDDSKPTRRNVLKLAGAWIMMVGTGVAASGFARADHRVPKPFTLQLPCQAIKTTAYPCMRMERSTCS